MSKVTWHAISRNKTFSLIAMQEGEKLRVIPKSIIDLVSNDGLLRLIEVEKWYDASQDPEIIFRGEVVRNPGRHALKVQL